jgi:hypothetical protein
LGYDLSVCAHVSVFMCTYFGTIFIFKHVLLKFIFTLQCSNFLLQFKKFYVIFVWVLFIILYHIIRFHITRLFLLAISHLTCNLLFKTFKSFVLTFVFLTVQVLHAQGKIKSSDVWVTEPEFSEVPVVSLQLPWLEICQPSIETFLTISVLIIGLLVGLSQWLLSTIFSR